MAQFPGHARLDDVDASGPSERKWMIEQASGPQDSPAQPDSGIPEAGGLDALHAELAATRLQLAESEKARLALVEREKLLRGELQHRLRNLLAIVRSIFSRTVSAGDSMDDFADHFRGRLDALTRHQGIRLLDPVGDSDLEAAVRDELRSFEFDQRVFIEGPEVRIGHDLGEILGLALHELSTNAIKFGALAGMDDRTRLNVTWNLAEDVLTLRWEETGVRVIAPAPIQFGFGREYIEQALPYQLSAMTSFELRAGGLLCIIAVPLP